MLPIDQFTGTETGSLELAKGCSQGAWADNSELKISQGPQSILYPLGQHTGVLSKRGPGSHLSSLWSVGPPSGSGGLTGMTVTPSTLYVLGTEYVPRLGQFSNGVKIV